MQIINSLAKWQLVPLMFTQEQVAATQTAAAVYAVEVAGAVLSNVYYTMPFAGEIIGISLNLDAAGTAGTLTVVPTLSGTVCTDPTASVTTLAYASDKCPRGTNVFARNAQVGVKITTTADWNGTSSDILAIVWVLLAVTGI